MYKEPAHALRACQDLVCACTGTKRLLFKIGRIVHNRGEVAIGGTLIAGALIVRMMIGYVMAH